MRFRPVRDETWGRHHHEKSATPALDTGANNKKSRPFGARSKVKRSRQQANSSRRSDLVRHIDICRVDSCLEAVKAAFASSAPRCKRRPRLFARRRDRYGPSNHWWRTTAIHCVSIHDASGYNMASDRKKRLYRFRQSRRTCARARKQNSNCFRTPIFSRLRHEPRTSRNQYITRFRAHEHIGHGQIAGSALASGRA